MGEWIEHTGDHIPYPAGTAVECVLRSGIITSFVRGSGVIGPDGRQYRGIQALGSVWIWGSSMYPDREVIKHRLSDTDDKAKREARMERFREIAAGKDQIIEETLKPRTPAPQKAGL